MVSLIVICDPPAGWYWDGDNGELLNIVMRPVMRRFYAFLEAPSWRNNGEETADNDGSR